jgi:hypothetical protein
MVATLVWAGTAAAQPAHVHELSEGHVDSIHALASHPDADHHAAVDVHDHDHDAGEAPDEDGGVPSGHEHGIFHVHAFCFIALAAEYVSFQHDATAQAVAPAELIVALHTRSIGPADRPPRTFL